MKKQDKKTEKIIDTINLRISGLKNEECIKILKAITDYTITTLASFGVDY